MFKEKLALVPELPGSYQMKDKDNNIIYVGKAKNLKKRLKSYFTGRVTGKTKKLVSDIADFEYIVTTSELESLILEITLIKKYNPKYNILLKDDKSLIDAVGFSLGIRRDEIRIGDKIDVVANVELNSYNTPKTIQLVIQDFKKSV